MTAFFNKRKTFLTSELVMPMQIFSGHIMKIKKENRRIRKDAVIFVKKKLDSAKWLLMQ
jgi:hypothetical protein